VRTARRRNVWSILRFTDSTLFRDVDGARPAGRGNVKGLLHGHGQIADVLDEKVVLDAGPGNADGIDLLKRIIANQRCGHLSGKDHQRY